MRSLPNILPSVLPSFSVSPVFLRKKIEENLEKKIDKNGLYVACAVSGCKLRSPDASCVRSVS